MIAKHLRGTHLSAYRPKYHPEAVNYRLWLVQDGVGIVIIIIVPYGKGKRILEEFIDVIDGIYLLLFIGFFNVFKTFIFGVPPVKTKTMFKVGSFFYPFSR